MEKIFGGLLLISVCPEIKIVARPSDFFGRKAAGRNRWLISGQTLIRESLF
jgi:hypothetical protein